MIDIRRYEAIIHPFSLHGFVFKRGRSRQLAFNTYLVKTLVCEVLIIKVKFTHLGGLLCAAGG